jgi:hypothetical protein
MFIIIPGLLVFIVSEIVVDIYLFKVYLKIGGKVGAYGSYFFLPNIDLYNFCIII